MNNLMPVFILWTGLIVSMNFEVTHNHLGNSSHPDKDMYVIHATVYEVGILTNKTNNGTSNYNTTGTQESVTFYHTNGTHMDLSAIPKPVLTNVTAQSMVEVAPVGNGTKTLPWGNLGPFASLPNTASTDHSAKSGNLEVASLGSSRSIRKLFKRDESGGSPVKVVKGTAVIPPAVGLQSLGLPPMLSLNNNLSSIPVPIPNTAVVQYAKVNTLVHTP